MIKTIHELMIENISLVAERDRLIKLLKKNTVCSQVVLTLTQISFSNNTENAIRNHDLAVFQESCSKALDS